MSDNKVRVYLSVTLELSDEAMKKFNAPHGKTAIQCKMLNTLEALTGVEFLPGVKTDPSTVSVITDNLTRDTELADKFALLVMQQEDAAHEAGLRFHVNVTNGDDVELRRYKTFEEAHSYVEVLCSFANPDRVAHKEEIKAGLMKDGSFLVSIPGEKNNYNGKEVHILFEDAGEPVPTESLFDVSDETQG